jgi:hypothetical protein
MARGITSDQQNQVESDEALKPIEEQEIGCPKNVLARCH